MVEVEMGRRCSKGETGGMEQEGWSKRVTECKSWERKRMRRPRRKRRGELVGKAGTGWMREARERERWWRLMGKQSACSNQNG